MTKNNDAQRRPLSKEAQEARRLPHLVLLLNAIQDDIEYLVKTRPAKAIKVPCKTNVDKCARSSDG